jgi:exopolysaccharide biosynthesis WecB/TagA/CpsF family protein
VLIVGLGAPKQEIWIDRYRGAMPNVRIFMGVGATIDYEADAVPRAPRWMTRNGLEWLYRITTEPKRYWRRYLRDMEFFWLVAMDGLGRYRPPTFSKSER